MFESSLFTLIIALILYVFKPGPGMATYVTRTIQQGYSSGVAIAVGVTLVEFGYLMLAMLSLAIINPQVLQASLTVKAIAAAYLIFLGVRGFIQLRRGDSIQFGDKKKWMTLAENFFMGVMVTLSNPYTFLFYATVIPTILDMDSNTMSFGTQVMIVGGVGFACRLTIITLAHQAREALANTKFVHVVNAITSAIFILIGCFLVFSLLPIFVPRLFG